jgi:glycosyltransferase involved in cell wall biosynthesis
MPYRKVLGLRRVDIVVPCWNAERTLGATIDSALGETGIGSIVVVDDGSTDGSLALARAYEPRVSVLTGPNQGVAAARDRGAAEGTADWVIFLDSDDVLTRDTIARRLATAAESDADVVVCDWLDIEDGASPVPEEGRYRSIDWEMFRRDPGLGAATRVWATTAAIMYKRSLVERIGGFRADVSPIEDARFFFDAAMLGARFAHSPHFGAYYRIVPGSLSRADPARFWTRVLRNGQQIEALWRERGLLDAAHREGLLGIYNNAARGLFALAHRDFFVALAAQRRLGLPRPMHGRVAEPLARLFGLRAARSMLTMVGRP